MIVKFHPRGRGGGAGPVDYLLGKDRQREGASVLQGKPEEVRELNAIEEKAALEYQRQNELELTLRQKQKSFDGPKMR